MSLLFNMLSRLAVASLPRSKYLLISWLQSLSAVILEPKKIKRKTQMLPIGPFLNTCLPPMICEFGPGAQPLTG